MTKKKAASRKGRAGAPKIRAALAEKLYRAVVRARKFEEKIIELYPEKEMRCPTHLSVGQEGVAAGVCGALRKDDLIFSTHRCHSHTIAKGSDFKLMFAELYGKEAGCSRGKGGSMHFVQPDVGMMGSSAIVGGTVPLALGAAMAAKMQGKDTVTVAFFGDGALEQGSFHESMNFATHHKLPLVFACENNGLATCTVLPIRQPYTELYKRAAGYRMPGVRVDGSDIFAVYEAAQAAVDRARAGEGPSFLEGVCCRWKEHVGPNDDFHLGFRTKEEVDRWKAKDPVKMIAKTILEKKLLPQAKLDAIADEIQSEINEAIAFAKQAPFPAVETMYQDL